MKGFNIGCFIRIIIVIPYLMKGLTKTIIVIPDKIRKNSRKLSPKCETITKEFLDENDIFKRILRTDFRFLCDLS